MCSLAAIHRTVLITQGLIVFHRRRSRAGRTAAGADDVRSADAIEIDTRRDSQTSPAIVAIAARIRGRN
jgi:hypothetical protein